MRWWAPEHFRVDECLVEPVLGGHLRIVLAEADGNRHVSEGVFTAIVPDREIAFTQAPLGADGRSLFEARYRVTLEPSGPGTRLDLVVRTTAATPDAAPALAGLEPGWNQLLNNLERLLAAGVRP
jgi:uncharacterized protein YndB with AHSA1/START domain